MSRPEPSKPFGAPLPIPPLAPAPAPEPARAQAPRPAFSRISRHWVLPASAVTLALSGLAVLASIPTDPVAREWHRANPVARALAAPGAPAPALVPPAAAPAPVQAPRALATTVTLAPERPEVACAAPDDFAREIGATRDLGARLRIVDRLILTQAPDDAAKVIERLLECPPGDTADDMRAMKVALLARLGCLPQCARADQRLCAAVEPDQPRPERLIAIESLVRGGLHPLGRPYLQRIAAGDHDLEVRKKAQWALAQISGS